MPLYSWDSLCRDGNDRDPFASDEYLLIYAKLRKNGIQYLHTVRYRPAHQRAKMNGLAPADSRRHPRFTCVSNVVHPPSAEQAKGARLIAFWKDGAPRIPDQSTSHQAVVVCPMLERWPVNVRVRYPKVGTGAWRGRSVSLVSANGELPQYGHTREQYHGDGHLKKAESKRRNLTGFHCRPHRDSAAQRSHIATWVEAAQPRPPASVAPSWHCKFSAKICNEARRQP